MSRSSYHQFFTSFSLLTAISIVLISDLWAADESTIPFPKVSLNGEAGNVTVQDLSGLISRPLRLLVKRNNEAHGAEFIQVHALGVRVGDELKVKLAVPLPGVRATVYQIKREKDGPRYLSMPASVYFAEANTATYEERIEPFEQEYLILVFEKTDSPDEKNVQIRYFEERVRHLVVQSYKTNVLFSSLKLKMRDFGEADTGTFFERDAQLLIDRLVNAQKIFLIRLWQIRPENQ